MKSFFTLLCFIVVLNVNAQNGNPDTIPDTANAVIIHKDPRLDLLVKKQAEVNKVTGVDNRKTDKGYRILVISTNNREEALKAKTKIYTYFPDLKAYLWYQSPYFRVKAGNFKDKQTADKYKNRLSVYFPNGVFVMKDIIEQKKGKGLNDEKED
ncbi:MAG TPA: SPOR domain-containing protein [Chitinophagaceae bacterium]|nr:SPOR domain-containing protein [Chitinophagaceae bacterium]HNA92231.1 SPOR domain-containing protein [Chitinophagaceae bacterium]HNA95998.1 SPOR domain-containing protein [Chitinophagaceae bacterium]HNF37868.1 SPOR domain-containing protein [Chitinophagaceae bacterium]